MSKIASVRFHRIVRTCRNQPRMLVRAAERIHTMADAIDDDFRLMSFYVFLAEALTRQAWSAIEQANRNWKAVASHRKEQQKWLKLADKIGTTLD